MFSGLYAKDARLFQLTLFVTSTLLQHVLFRSEPSFEVRNPMKNLLLTTVLLILLSSCGNDPKEDPQYQQYVEDAKKAEARVADRDSTINDMFGTLNKISENLRTIRAKQGKLDKPYWGMENGANIEDQ